MYLTSGWKPDPSWPGSLVPALGSVTFYQTEVATLVSLLFPYTEKINRIEREVCIWPEVSLLDFFTPLAVH